MTGFEPLVRRLFLALVACVLATRIIVFCDVANAAPLSAPLPVAMASHDCGGSEMPSDKPASHQDKCVAGCALMSASTLSTESASFVTALPHGWVTPQLTEFDDRPVDPPPRHASFD